MYDLAARLQGKVQLTTDGHKPYLNAEWEAFGIDIDYAVLQKMYGNDPTNETRYSPAICAGTDVRTIRGNPDPWHSTRYV